MNVGDIIRTVLSHYLGSTKEKITNTRKIYFNALVHIYTYTASIVCGFHLSFTKFRKKAQQESETGDEESRDEKINNKKVKKAAQHVDLSTNEIPQL